MRRSLIMKEFEKALEWTKKNCKEGKDLNPSPKSETKGQGMGNCC
jgi:hypothetical protein